MSDLGSQNGSTPNVGHEQNEPLTATIKVPLGIPTDETGTEDYQVTLDQVPLDILWGVYTVLQEIGIDRVKEFLVFAAEVGIIVQKLPSSVRGQAFYIIWDKLADLFTVPNQQMSSKEDLVLAFTYNLLRQKSITHKQASDIASQLLEHYFSDDAWRKRVARWANRHGLPQVEQRKRSKG